MVRHVYAIVYPYFLSRGSLSLIWAVTFASLAWTALLAVLERPKKANRLEQIVLDRLSVVVLIPAYNEEPALLRACIQSVLDQSRPVSHIEVVDDGSSHTYEAVKDWLRSITGCKTTLRWTRTANKGKRHAQYIGIRNQPDADIYLTLDSDTILDREAVAEGLKPFKDPKTHAVAGICLPINVQDNLLTRFSGLWEMIWQLTERSAQSTLGCVTVNSGILALYRGVTIRKNIQGYLQEEFFGKAVKYSDDSLMTLYALLDGKTVQQPSAIAFSAIPNKMSHYIRRYIRWMRGSFIRTWWRFKYLPTTSYIYWWHLWRWVQFVMSTFVTVYLFTSGIVTRTDVLPYMVLITITMSYIQALRYFIIRRSDESRVSQCLTFLCAPLAAFWSLTVLRVVKWYAYLTVANNGWGTRKTQELSVMEAKA
jgi:hyaluronan synthase